jgi:phosphonate transport system substrate-binding protein
MWAGVNANDANAAIRAWAQTILSQRGKPVNVENQMFRDVDRFASALGEGQIDGASVPSETFLALDPKLRPDHLFLAVKQATPYERYVVLVHGTSGITNASGLRGRKITMHQSGRTSLAPHWLEAVMADPSEGIQEEASTGVVRTLSASRAVLGVFFRQSDACVITTNAFALACELNPQLRRNLRVLATSPEVVPSVFFIRLGYINVIKDDLESAILTLHKTTAGQQVLAVFQCDRMERHPASCLEGTRQLLADHERLRRNNGIAEPRLPLAQALNDEKR